MATSVCITKNNLKKIPSLLGGSDECFCKEEGFLFHKHGSGTFGADRYWTYQRVENNDRVVFTIEYFPVRNVLKIRTEHCRFEGTPESLQHLKELLVVMCVQI